jgi:peptidoglycan/LPS O-acetylase OafA/YrhL
MIAIGHSGIVDISHASYYMGVDYFFVLSGFLMVLGIEKCIIPLSTGKYLVKRIERLWPHQLWSFLIFILAQGFLTVGMDNILRRACLHFFEYIPFAYYWGNMLLAGEYALNYAAWYMSILLLFSVAGYYLYLNHKAVLVNVISPLVIVFGYMHLSNHCESFNTGADVGAFLNEAYVRGGAAFAAGVIAYQVVSYIKQYKYKKLFYVLVRLIEFLSFISALYLMVCHGNSRKDLIILGFIYIGIIASFIYQGNDNVPKPVKYLNDLTFAVYLNHLFVFWLFRTLGITNRLISVSRVFAIIVVMLVTGIYSCFTKCIVDRIVLIVKKSFFQLVEGREFNGKE